MTIVLRQSQGEWKTPLITKSLQQEIFVSLVFLACGGILCLWSLPIRAETLVDLLIKSNSPVFHLSLDAAYEAAREDDTLVLLIFRAKWSSFCQAFTETTLESEEFTQSLVRIHVALLDVDDHKKFAKEFRVDSIPDLILLTPDGKIIARQSGLMEPAELLLWIMQGKQKAEQGEWSGFSPSGEFGKFLEKFDTGKAADADYKKLINMLGSKVPGDRVLAIKVLGSQREKAIPFLIDAVEDPYLGIRVGVNEVLLKLAPEAPAIDPWASEEDRKQAIARLRSWWDASSHQYPVTSHQYPASSIQHPASSIQHPASSLQSVQDALNAVLSNDPVTRTEAMTFLVEMGDEVLPALRDAIEHAETHGVHQSVWALEDIRWSILIPPQIVQKIPNIRRVLARGSSRERQEITEKLGSLGILALPVLSELIHDSDPLFQESAVHSLAGIDSDDALEVMAVLLESEDANLRMVAAQLLGKTKNKDAAKYLVRVLTDPDEVVAATAIAALVELKVDKVDDTLIACLEDARWRIRAAAAEAIGELEISKAGEPLKKLLQDPDAFVVKSAMVALSEIEISVDSDEMKSLITKHPDLISVMVKQVLEEESRESINMLSSAFEELSLQHKMILLDTLAQGYSYGDEEGKYWRPLFRKVLAHENPTLRLKAVQALEKNSPELASEFVTELLRDPDLNVRQAAAGLTLSIICFHYGYNGYSYKKPSFWQKLGFYGRHRNWHTLLVEDTEGDTSLEKMMVMYLTGSDFNDFGQLQETLTEQNVQNLLQKHYGRPSLELLLSRLPWPESRSLIQGLTTTPDLYAALVSVMDRGNPKLIEYVLDEKHLLKNLRHAAGESQKLLAEVLLKSGRIASLLSPTGQASQRALALMKSTNPFSRSIGITANSSRKTIAMEQFIPFLEDRNPWVRRAAVMAVTDRAEKLDKRESLLGPLLQDENVDVLQVALIALLAEDIRRKADLHDRLPYYKYENLEFDSFRDYEQQSTRPLAVIDRKPEFLEEAWKLFEASSEVRNPKPETRNLIVVLMAQYGEFEALDIALKEQEQNNAGLLNSELLTAIELSKDVKYVPVLKKYAEQHSDKDDLRKVLTTIRRMRGKEARAFRKDLNKHLREMD